MTDDRWTKTSEAHLAAKFAGVGLIGFAVDAALLHLGLTLGLAAWSARAISLFCAMQVTFVVNGMFVFRCLTRRRLARQWLSYMITQGTGNLVNYWIFITLISLHRGLVANPYFALCVSAFVAWMINYAGVRLLVFGRGRLAAVARLRRRASGLRPGSAATETDI